MSFRLSWATWRNPFPAILILTHVSLVRGGVVGDPETVFHHGCFTILLPSDKKVGGIVVRTFPAFSVDRV